METETKRDITTGISREMMEQAQEGDALTQYQLASYLYVGDGNKAPDKEQGFRWMQASAENGCVKAQKVLGLLYMNGQHSPWPEQDLEKAVAWYKKAAEFGDAEAMYWLSCCYQKGVGVLYNETKAAYWRDKAREKGYDVGGGEEGEPDPAVSSSGSTQGRSVRTPGRKPWEQYDVEEEPQPVSPKKRKRDHAKNLKEKGMDIAQEGAPFTPRHDIEYVKAALVYGVIALSVGIILCCLAAVLINVFSPGFFLSSKRSIFLIVSGIASLALGAVAFRNGYLSAYEEARRSAWFRKTPFYRQYHIDFDRLNAYELQEYEYYSALEKSFRPCSWQDPIPRGLFREFRGYMFMGLYFGRRGEAACPDFVIVTEKSVYVIACMDCEGKLHGRMDEMEWSLSMGNGRSRVIPNPVLQNERRIQIIKKDCRDICPWVESGRVPFYSLILAGPNLSVDDVTGAHRSGKIHLLQMSGEEVRSYIEVMESKNALHEEETTELVKAVEQIAGEYTKRRNAFGKEAI